MACLPALRAGNFLLSFTKSVAIESSRLNPLKPLRPLIKRKHQNSDAEQEISLDRTRCIRLTSHVDENEFWFRRISCIHICRIIEY